jgi:hypothetical protein
MFSNSGYFPYMYHPQEIGNRGLAPEQSLAELPTTRTYPIYELS